MIGSELINNMINIQQDFIKKAKIRYLKCKVGGLHSGQTMNFICIDPTCKQKGLICPVCRSTFHDGHQVIHLKIFLNEIDKNLNSQSNADVSAISDHLRKLQSTHKQVLTVLKQTVRQIASKVKIVQERIKQSYVSVRKAILSQSTLGNKLPHLYELITSDKIQDQDYIHQQISKCSQLLQYRNNKIYAIDSVSKLIEQYSNMPSAMLVHLSTVVPTLTKLFETLPIKIKKFGNQQLQTATEAFLFSKTKKSSTIKLAQDFKSATVDGQQMGGILFVQHSKNEASKSKISIKISQSVSDSISLGIGNPQLMKTKQFKFDEADNSGLFGICSMGIILNDFQNQSFVFAKDDIIDMIWDPQDIKITFSRRNGIQKYQIYPQITPEEAKKLCFFVSLLIPGDKVEIVV